MSVPVPLRVLALIETYHNLGPALNLLEFARQAAAPPAGLPPVELAVVSFQRGASARPTPLVAAAREAGLRTWVIRERRRYDWSVRHQLRAIVAEYQPDILQSHNVKSHFLIRQLGLYRRHPWVAFAHGYTSRDILDRLYSQIDRWSLRRACRVVAVSRALAETLKRRGVPAGRISILHNAVRPFLPPPPEEVARLREGFGLSDNVPLVLSVGRLSREKGHADLIQAAAVLRDRALEFRLVLLGDGPERAALERQTARLALKDRVLLAGHRTDVASFYAIARLLVLPSHSEGSPNVILESAAAGVPVVATRVGGVPEILEAGRTGLLVERARPLELAAAIESLLKDAALCERLARAARQAVLAGHAPEERLRRLIGFYQGVLEASPRAPAAGAFH